MLSDPKWSEIPQSEIDKELDYWHTKKGASRVWLYPCRYTDGSPTVYGTLIRAMPSDPDSWRLYELQSHFVLIQHSGNEVNEVKDETT